MLGHWEILAIFLLILLIFGGKKIPEVARGLGKGLKEFKKAKDDITDSINEEDEEKDDKLAEIHGSDSSEKPDKKSDNEKDKKTT